MGAMPMFPLGTVLVPGALLPLHVFEERYRRLVADCVNGDIDPEFGVVLIDRGHEVGGGDVRREVGTVARILEVGALPDGRFAMQTAGVRRIRVNRWLDDRPYPHADVDEWPDEDQSLVSGERVDELLVRLRRVRALASELGEPAGPLDVRLAPDPVLATYHLVALSPVGPDDAYRLLSCPGPGERLDRLDALLADVELVLRLRLEEGGDSGPA
jgi:Lon protease-like protein